MPAARNPRILLAAGLVVIALVLLVVILPSAGGGDDAAPRIVRAPLTLEQYTRPDTGASELLISLPATQLNTLETTGGETSVLLRCVDGGGGQAIREPTGWPMLEEAGYPTPHLHRPAQQRVLSTIRSCRLTGPNIDFAGSVPGRLPVADL